MRLGFQTYLPLPVIVAACGDVPIDAPTRTLNVERRLVSQPDALLYRYLVDDDPSDLAPIRRVD